MSDIGSNSTSQISVGWCRQAFESSAPLVVKIGSSLLIDAQGSARRDWMSRLAAQLARRPGPFILVSSGAIGLGRGAIGLRARPASLAEAQAAAAIGQICLAQLWSDVLGRQGLSCGQMLLTLGDLEDRGRYLNARNTLHTLLGHGIVPVINENDTVATGEIRFGDNDRLAARVAQLAGAELLVLLSDVDGLHDANPASNPQAQLIPEVERVTSEIESLADAASTTDFGTGGMISKLAAARIATAAGCHVLLTSGRGKDEPLERYLSTGRGTLFRATDKPLVTRKQWLRGLQHQAGVIHVDAGAVAALARGASLLAAGATRVEGSFERGALVAICGPDGPVGQGLCGYNAADARRLVGVKSDRIEQVLGYPGRGAMIHRDDLVLF